MSKFARIFEAKRQEPEPNGDDEKQGPAVAPVANRAETPPAPPAPAPPVNPSPALPEPPPPVPKRGRPPGKRSDPRFIQCTAYVPEDLHRRVKIALLQEAKGQEFSELVSELLVSWLASRD